MLARTARVVTCVDDYVELRLDPMTSCRACTGNHGCGVGPLISVLQGDGGTCRVPLPAGVMFRPGELVRLILPPAGLLRAAALAYLLPLVAGFAGAWLAGGLASPGAADACAAAGGLAGLGLAVLCGRRLGRGLAAPRVLPASDPAARDS